MSDARVVLAGDALVVLELDDRVDPAVNARAIAIAEAAEERRWPGVLDVVPTFRSIGVAFDPRRTDLAAVVADLRELAQAVAAEADEARAVIDVPVCYGDEFGPDLVRLAGRTGLSPEEVVARHLAPTYRVYMLGFVPGFTYMGTVDPAIRAPRHATPRLRVPAGSVGIADFQTGIYPAETPGGWHIIGRTPLRPFDETRAEPFLFRAGDRVKFVRIDPAGFSAMHRSR